MVTALGKRNKGFRLNLAIILVISILCSGTLVFAGEIQAAEYKEYLKDNYAIVLPDTVTKGDFVRAVEKISGATYADIDKTADLTGQDKALTNSEALALAVKAAGMKELAYTYPKTKVESALLGTGINYSSMKDTNLQSFQEYAAAADCGLLPTAWKRSYKPESPINRTDAEYLLGKILSFRGKYKNYLGYVFDEDIYNKVYNSWNTQSLIEAGELRKIVDQVLKAGAVTGYNLKDARFNANFDKDLAVTYGHSDIKHALQLIALLRSEDLNAKVQLEPKTSAYIYLKEWGEPVESSDFKVLKIENGNFIAYSKEYDISFEFDNQNQKNRFQKIILSYAKRNQDSMAGLIAGSWWQPLYYSDTEIGEYVTITNNYIKKDNYIAQSFSLNDKSNDVVQGFKKADPKLQVFTYKFWVNEAFYNYLLGGYK